MGTATSEIGIGQKISALIVSACNGSFTRKIDTDFRPYGAARSGLFSGKVVSSDQ
jgi:hypothetical protein